MAQDDDKLVKIADDSDVLDAVAERLAASESPQDVVLWTQVRGEILRQNEEAENRRHQRQMKNSTVWQNFPFNSCACCRSIALAIWIYNGWLFCFRSRNVLVGS